MLASVIMDESRGKVTIGPKKWLAIRTAFIVEGLSINQCAEQFHSNEVWAGPWRKSLKGDWVRDIAPSRKERHKKSVQVTVTQDEAADLSIPQLKEMLRKKAAEAIQALNAGRSQ